MISSDQQQLVDRLVEEFTDRQQKGEAPSIDEYCERHPELAEEIRDVFEALMMVEDLKPGSQDESGTFGKSVPVGQRLDQVGDYRILNEIGRGGMGIVYEAEQLSLGRRVAVKVLPQQVAGSGKALARFQREAKAAARMHHTNIVPVFDVGTANEHVYYAMQLIQGQGLDLVIDDLQRMRQWSSHEGVDQAGGDPAASKGSPRGSRPGIAQSLVSGHFEQVRLDGGQPAKADPAVDPNDPELTATIAVKTGSSVSASLPGKSDISTADEDFRAYHISVAEIGQQAASALAYAHARGIIHRDIKPSNLLLDSAGIVWVTDFGLAKTGDEALTHTGDILGTIRYMSPERFCGRCDVRADIYALGLTLYELLTLKPAYSASDQGSLIGIISKTDPATPRSIDPRIPRDLETIVLKAIDKEPRRRYQSADEMEEDLQRFINDEPIKARRVSLVERFSRWSRRNKPLAASLMFAALLLLIINIAGPVMTWRLWRLNADLNVTKKALTAAKDVADQDRIKAIESREMAVEAQSQLERQLYNSDMQRMRGVYQDGSLGQARQLLTKYITTDEGRDLRGWEWYYWLRATHLESIERRLSYVLGELVVAPDESWIAVNGYQNFVQIVDSQSLSVVKSFQLDYPGGDVDALLAVSADGELLAGSDKDGQVRLWQTGVWSELEPLKTGSDLTLLAFSKSGLLATGDAQGRITLWNVEQRSIVGTPLETGQSLRTLAFSPDGHFLLTGGGLADVETERENTEKDSVPSLLVWDLRNHTSEAIDHDEGDATDVVAVRWSPRASHGDSIIAVAFSDGAIRLLSGATFEPLHQIVAEGSVEVIALSSDGSRLAAGTVITKSIQVWETETAEQISEIRAHSREIGGIAFTENGECLLSTAHDGRLKSWKIDQSQPFFQFRAQDLLGGASGVEFAPDLTLLSRLRNAEKVRMMSGLSDKKQMPGRLGTHGPTWHCAENLAYMAVYKQVSTDKVNVEIWKIDGVEPVRIEQKTIANPTADQELTDLAICEDASVVAWCVGGEVFVLKVGTGILMRVTSDTDEPFGHLILSPDGKSLVVWTIDPYENVTWDLSGNQAVRLVTFGGPVPSARFSPDGNQLAQAFWPSHVRVVNPRTGEVIYEFAGHAGGASYVAFSPDGSRLASGGADGVVRLWNLDSSASEESMLALPGHRNRITYVAFAPDGSSLLSSSVDGDIRVWPITDNEDDSRLLHELVVHWIEQEQFDEARASMEKLVANPWDRRHRNPEVQLGLLHAYVGDRDAHETYSRELLGRYASSQDPFDAACGARIYLVMPGPHDPQLLEQAIRQGRRCAELGAESYYVDWFESFRGIAEFRAGADAEAIEWLSKATDGPFDILRPMCLAYQAMAEFRLGHADEAKRLLREAEHLTSRTKPSGDNWHNELACRMAVQEATRLIFGQSNLQ